MDHFCRGSWRCALLSITALASCPAVALAGDEQRPPSIESGLIEEERVTLMLVDVLALDEQGHPMPGLQKKDFTVRLNGGRWAIQSLDDLCPAARFASADEPADGTGGREDAPASDATVQRGSHRPDLPPVEPTRFVLYFDFGQLRPDGRERAMTEAKRWVRDVMRPGEEASVLAHAYHNGLKELSPFTSDKEALLAAIEGTDSDAQLLDAFPAALPNRIETCCVKCGQEPGPGNCCTRCCPTGDTLCSGYAYEEFIRSRQSLRALKQFIESLEGVPGRKTLILFQQNVGLAPGRFYSIPVSDHVALLDELGAEATLSRTSIYPAFTGESTPNYFPWIRGFPVNLGANLADFTGGSYSRGTTDVAGLVDGAGRESSCFYRIGILPPETAGDRVFRVRVEVHNRTLPGRYRVRILDELDRWWRRARYVLAHPGQARDVHVTASIVPVRASHGNWDGKVQVGLDVESLFLLPSAKGRTGNWEVGALLVNVDTRKSWEMLGVSELRRPSAVGRSVTILHERLFEGMHPGEYELRAFVRDRTQNVYGSARAEIVLPHPGTGGIAGPPLILTRGRQVLTSLPLREETGESTPSTASAGLLPLGDRAVEAGESLRLLTWICAAPDVPGKVRRSLTLPDGSETVFDKPDFGGPGGCAPLTDSLDTTLLAGGRHSYHLEWSGADGVEPQTAEVSFDVVGGPSVARTR